VFKQLLKSACAKNILIRNPCAYVKLPKTDRSATWKSPGQKPGAEHVKALDRGELGRLLIGLRGHSIYPVVALAIGTGARRGELLALEWRDIDFDKNTLSISKALEYTREFGVRFKDPKTERSKRIISLDSNTIGLLREHRKTQAEAALKLGMGLPSDALLFPATPLSPTVPHNPDYFTGVFLRVVKRLGFPKLRFHDLRHSVATELLTAGLPPHVVAERLGHSPAVLLKTYAHLLPKADSLAASICGGLLECTN
jgi:integrase